MYTISKEFNFSASHRLNGLSATHPCSELHGHNYIVIVELSGKTLNDVGMIVDYRELEDIKKYIDEMADHIHLNDIFQFNPTAENLAKFFYDTFKVWHPEITAVSVKETPKTIARYEEI